ncbi:SRPBCC family protein [Pseudonocardia nigra]|uniref:SRPBCC family protein n=1 Tax=Pseudonocardia nigra TaxID=1921578 RepID=UPI001C5EBA98|nr:SRPBCC domain-containing protein [Pseudonocardia nigra]
MTDEDLTAIHVDQFLPHPPERVWQALVDPDLLSAWFMPTDFAPVVGHRFTFRARPIEAVGFSGVVQCEVLEIREGELVRFSWADPERPDGLDSTVTWTLHPEGRGTRLFLEHRGFDPDDPVQQLSRTIMNGGWRSHVVRRLAEFLGGAGRPRPDRANDPFDQ